MGTRTEKTGPKTAAMRCRANQTERKRKKTKKSAKLKIQEERKASTNLLALQEHIPKMLEHGPKKPVRKPQLCGAEQTRPKESGRKQKKAQNWKSKKSAKLQRTFLLCKNTFPRCGNTDRKNGSENRSSAVQSKPDRKKARASQASEQRSGKNSPGRRRQQTEETQSKNKLWKNIVLVYIKEHQRQHTRRTATPPPPPPKKHQPTNAKFWHEFRNNAMELREHGNAFCNGYENKLRWSYVTNGRQKRPKWSKLRSTRGLISLLFENNTMWHVYHWNRLELSCSYH